MEHIYDPSSKESVAIVGDSQLIIRFLRQDWTPKDPFLYNGIQRIYTLLRGIVGLRRYFHVPRLENCIADACATKAREDGADFIIFPEATPQGAEGAVLQVTQDELMQQPCFKCHQRGNAQGSDMLVCD